MRRPVALLCLVLLGLLAPYAAAQATAATAATYTYPLKVEDPAGDQQGLSIAPPPAPNPGDSNPENDVLAFEVTNDGSELVIRYTMAVIGTFTVPGPVTLTVAMTGPDGEDWEATVSYRDEGAEPSVADFDPASGDEDELVPGARVEVDAANAQVYVFISLDEAGLAIGDAIDFDAVGCGKGIDIPQVGTLTENNRDVVDVTDQSYTIADPASAAPPAPPTNTTPPAPPAPTSSSTSSTSAPPPAPPTDPNAGSEDDTATGGFPLQEDDKDTPAGGVAVVALALLVVALAARRRLS